MSTASEKTAQELQQAESRIGPNSIIQTVAALKERLGVEETRAWLERIGRGDLNEAMPTTMVVEHEFLDLIGHLREWQGLEVAAEVLERSGELTAAYVMANRIPAPIRTLLRIVPGWLGLRILLAAIKKHAWTFAGSGQFSYRFDRGLHLQLAHCIECQGIQSDTPICRYYCGAFRGMIGTLIDPKVQVREIACSACGAGACEFVVER
jgi:divinyl protochlorophyllide a 8-vinyl-reductase